MVYLEWLLYCAIWTWGLAPSIHWFDSGDLTLSVYTLGIGHPPGQPPYVAFASPFRWLPIGDFAQRISFFSLLMGSAIFFFYLQKHSKFMLRLGLCFSGLVAIQTLRVEVYSLSAILTLLSIHFFSEKEDVRLHWFGWIFFGLSFANHPIIALTAVPFIPLQLKSSKGILFFSLASLILLYLPLRAQNNPAWDFGHPASFSQLLWFLEGKLYGGYSGIGFEQFFHNLISVFSMVSTGLGKLGVWIFGLGVGFALSMDFKKSFKPLLGVLITIYFLAIQNAFVPLNPDAMGYFLVSICLLTCLTSLGISKIEALLSKAWMKSLLWGLIGIWCFVSAKVYFQEAWLQKDYSAHRHLTNLLNEPSSGNEVQTASFTTFGMMRYGQVIEGRRPDLIISYRGLPPEAMGKKSFPHLAHSYWELALIGTPSGNLVLRKEDQQLVPSLQPSGWFFQIEKKGDRQWLKHFEGQTELVQMEKGPFFGFLGEEAAQNYIGKILFARARLDSSLENNLGAQFETLFPYIHLYNYVRKP